MGTVRSFRIRVPEEQLVDMRERLTRTRWPDAVVDGWDHGADVAYLRDLCASWVRDFDWRAQESRLNELPQFIAQVDDAAIHFVHYRHASATATPLLMLHGWPSSFLQMMPTAALLVGGFHLVVASLPGYGFSDRPTEPGMSVRRQGDLLHRLMVDELGYQRYGVRGSDLGAGVAQQMAIAHPDAVIGLHVGGTMPWVTHVPDDLSEAEGAFIANVERWRETEMAYAQMHASKPQTVAVALNDSPAGLAAWIVEKLRRWSDCDGDVEQAFGRHDLLTHLTIYWVTETIASSIRLYLETVRDADMGWGPPTVPVAMAMPPADMFPTPREWVERQGPIARWTELSRGGHFPDWEVPDEMAADITSFFADLSTER